MHPLPIPSVCAYCQYSPIDGGLIERCISCCQKERLIGAYHRQETIHLARLLVSGVKQRTPELYKALLEKGERADLWFESLFEIIESELERDRPKKT